MVEVCIENLSHRQGKNQQFRLMNEYNPILSLQADVQWGQFFLELFEGVEDIGFSIDDLLIEDYHWRWYDKALSLIPPNYEWFFLKANKKFQAVMIIYHPQESRIDKDSIVYIDYLAVAPWNRNITDKKKQKIFHKPDFKGLGTFMIQKANQFLGRKLKYREGFSLHSLPAAVPFYQKIRMTSFGPDPLKQSLHYFEMEEKIARDFINGV